jgi:hypothetical protein
MIDGNKIKSDIQFPVKKHGSAMTPSTRLSTTRNTKMVGDCGADLTMLDYKAERGTLEMYAAQKATLSF